MKTKSIIGFFFIRVLVILTALPIVILGGLSESIAADPDPADAKKSQEDIPPENKVLPLNAWVRPEKGPLNLDGEPEPTDVKERNPEEGYFFIKEDDLKVIDEGGGEEEVEPTPTLPDERRLPKKKRKRIEKAMSEQRKRVIKTLSETKRAYYLDKRGERELRVCSANVNGYGSRGSVGKLLRGKSRKQKNSRKGKSLVRSIVEAQCDIVALQGVIARDFDSFDEVLGRLVRQLKKKDKASEREWKYYLGETNDRFVTNVYLLDESRAEFVNRKSDEGILLPRFGRFQEKKFARGPFQLFVKVKNKESLESKEIILLTASAQKEKTFDKKKVEPVSYRMQVAEAVRQIAMKVQRELDTEDAPIMLVLFDSFGSLRQATSHILEGRLQLPDFKDDGPCKVIRDPESEIDLDEIEDEEKRKREQFELEEKDGFFSCEKWPKHPARLIPLLRSSVQPTFTVNKVIKDGEPRYRKIDLTQAYYRKKKDMLTRTAEIFVVPEDLKYVSFKHDTPGNYAVGSVELRNYLENSPLIWVDVNW